MSEVSYSNVPPMMLPSKVVNIEAIRSLLHAGHSPNEPQCYHVMIGDWPRDDEASPLELAILENRMDMVQLLIECGADLTHNPEELLCGSLRSQDLDPCFPFGRCGSQNPRNTKGYMQAVSPLDGSG